MKISTVIFSGLLVLLLGCGNSKQDGLPKMGDMLSEQTGQSGRECVRIPDIKGYGFNDNILSIDGRRYYYLATTVYRCHAMDMAGAAAFDGPGNEVCGGGASSVGSRDGRCPIAKVFKFDNREAAFEALDKAKETLAMATDMAEKTVEKASQ